MYLFIKTFITSFFSLCLVGLLIGLIFLWITKKQRLGKIIITVGFLLLFLFSLPFFPDFLLGHLEQQYPVFTIDKNKDKLSDVKYVVVLAGGHTLDSRLPLISQFSYSGLVRLIEGIKLYHKLPGIKLILSGGRGIDPVTDAELMADLSLALDIPKDDIILELESRSTYDEAIFLKSVVKNESFLLVTSASHMPRAVGLFKKQGMRPIAVPTDYLVKKAPFFHPAYLIPDADNLRKIRIAFYEYLGLIKERLLGHI